MDISQGSVVTIDFAKRIEDIKNLRIPYDIDKTSYDEKQGLCLQYWNQLESLERQLYYPETGDPKQEVIPNAIPIGSVEDVKDDIAEVKFKGITIKVYCDNLIIAP